MANPVLVQGILVASQLISEFFDNFLDNPNEIDQDRTSIRILNEIRSLEADFGVVQRQVLATAYADSQSALDALNSIKIEEDTEVIASLETFAREQSISGLNTALEQAAILMNGAANLDVFRDAIAAVVFSLGIRGTVVDKQGGDFASPGVKPRFEAAAALLESAADSLSELFEESLIVDVEFFPAILFVRGARYEITVTSGLTQITESAIVPLGGGSSNVFESDDDKRIRNEVVSSLSESIKERDVQLAGLEEFSNFPVIVRDIVDGEAFRGTQEADSLTGTENSDLLIGRGGNDTLSGLGDPDVIRGGSGADHLLGGEGGDRLDGGGGNDLLEGGNSDDRLEGGLGDDTIIGGSGYDVVVFDGELAEFERRDGDQPGSYIVSRGNEVDHIIGAEALIFNDTLVPLEEDLVPMQIAVLYDAVLNRNGVIDKGGFNWHIRTFGGDEETGADLIASARTMFGSNEFVMNFREPLEIEARDFTLILFNNILDREPRQDAPGFIFWVDVLQDVIDVANGQEGKLLNGLARVFIDFAFSEENLAQVDFVDNIVQIADGTWELVNDLF